MSSASFTATLNSFLCSELYAERWFQAMIALNLKILTFTLEMFLTFLTLFREIIFGQILLFRVTVFINDFIITPWIYS